MPVKKIVAIGFVLILLWSLTQNACVQATWASLRIRRGMTVNEALQVSGGDWIWGNAYSDRPAPEPSVSIPFNQRVIFHKSAERPVFERQVFDSLEEVAESLQQQMMGHPWIMSLTYVGAVNRPVVAVSFDAQGKVQRASPNFVFIP